MKPRRQLKRGRTVRRAMKREGGMQGQRHFHHENMWRAGLRARTRVKVRWLGRAMRREKLRASHFSGSLQRKVVVRILPGWRGLQVKETRGTHWRRHL